MKVIRYMCNNDSTLFIIKKRKDWYLFIMICQLYIKKKIPKICNYLSIVESRNNSSVEGFRNINFLGIIDLDPSFINSITNNKEFLEGGFKDIDKK